MTRNWLLGTTAAAMLAAALPASAADLAVAPPPMVPPAPVAFTWSGGYIGGNVGGVWGKYRFDPVTANYIGGATAPTALSSTFFAETTRRSSLIGGYQAGYNFQFGPWVLGLETDMQFDDLKSDFFGPVLTTGSHFNAGDVFRARNDWVGSTRVRGGFAWDRFLLYATGGLAYGETEVDAIFAGRAAPGSVPLYFSDKRYMNGYTVGGGAEFAITNNISVGVEYRYSDYGHENFNLGAFVNPSARSFAVSSETDLRTHQVLAKLNIKTDPLLAMFGLH